VSGDAAEIAKEALQAYEQGTFDLAIDLFEQAKSAYLTAGDPVKAAEMANNLSVTYGKIDRYVAAIEVLQGTFNVFVQHNDMMKAAQSLGNEAAAYEGLQEWEKAEALYEQAADRFTQLGHQESQHYTLQALSRVRLRQGRAMEAVSTMQGALETGAKSNWRNRIVRKILSLPSRLFRP
jgi:tetratricopeptide (TPR) repeat protein